MSEKKPPGAVGREPHRPTKWRRVSAILLVVLCLAWHTPLPRDAAVGYLCAVSPQLSSESFALLVAQSSHETDKWRRMRAYNFGGLKSINGREYETIERIDGRKQRVRRRFRTYSNPRAGARGFVSLLSTAPRYRFAWFILKHAPDPVSYAWSLYRAGYYTGSPKLYGLRLAKLQRQYIKEGVECMK